jgi:2-polyprenyl-3-methyl-5-hydroxy-6-metoxy-1,4-benzoquinol methylase
MSCCPPKGYETLFGERAARRDAKRYRRKGLDDTARRMVEFLRSRGIEGKTVLEIGGGVGAIDVELVKAGAEQAANVELSPYYEAAARGLWAEQGVADRVEYRVSNIAEDGQDVRPAEAVLMHRVVCCYLDYDALVGAAAERARRHLVMSFPRDRWYTRGFVAAVNAVARLLRWEHRSYVHAPAAIRAAAERRGLRPAFDHQGRIWEIAAFERP